MGRNRLHGALLALVCLGLLTGCAPSGASKDVPAGLDPSADRGGAASTEASAATPTVGEHGEPMPLPGKPGGLPDGVPATFPVPEGTVLGSTGLAVEEGASYTFAIAVADPPWAVRDWYIARFEGGGYDAGGALQTGEGATTGYSIVFTKGGQAEQGLVTIEGDGSGSKVSVTLTVER